MECASSKNHNIAEDIIKEYLVYKGYSIEDMSYHHNMALKHQAILKTAEDLTSYYFRTEPDYFVFNQEKSFFLEIKANEIKNDMICLEAYPLICSSIKDKELGIKTLYAHIDIENRICRSCWADNIVFDRIFVPELPKNKILINYFYKKYKLYYTKPKDENSGDPFVVVNTKDWTIKKI